MKPRWHIWSSTAGNRIPPEPITKETWRRIKDWPYENSGDGLWRQYNDQDGNPVLVLVKHRWQS